MPAPSELEGLLKYHERREERVYRAWFCAHQPTHISAWLQLGMHKLNDVDSKEFDEFVVADVAKHGNPEGVEQFVSHYNRLIDQRAAFFRRTYRIKQLLGMGGFSRVVSANRLIDGQVFALKISAKSFAEKRALELMDDELRIWAKDELVHPGLVCAFFGEPARLGVSFWSTLYRCGSAGSMSFPRLQCWLANCAWVAVCSMRSKKWSPWMNPPCARSVLR